MAGQGWEPPEERREPRLGRLIIPYGELNPSPIESDIYRIGYVDFASLDEVRAGTILKCSEYMREIILQEKYQGRIVDSNNPQVFLDAITRMRMELQSQPYSKEKETDSQEVALAELLCHNFFAAEGRYLPSDLEIGLLRIQQDSTSQDAKLVVELLTETICKGIDDKSFDYRSLRYKREDEIAVGAHSSSVDRAAAIVRAASFTEGDPFPEVDRRKKYDKVKEKYVENPWQRICRTVCYRRDSKIKELCPRSCNSFHTSSWLEFNLAVCIATGDRSDMDNLMNNYLFKLPSYPKGSKLNNPIAAEISNLTGHLKYIDNDPVKFAAYYSLARLAVNLLDIMGNYSSKPMSEEIRHKSYSIEGMPTAVANQMTRHVSHKLWQLGYGSDDPVANRNIGELYSVFIPKVFLHLLYSIPTEEAPRKKVAIAKAIGEVKQNLRLTPRLDVSRGAGDLFQVSDNPALAEIGVHSITFRGFNPETNQAELPISNPGAIAVELVSQDSEGTFRLILDRNSLSLMTDSGFEVGGNNPLYLSVLMYYHQIVSGEIYTDPGQPSESGEVSATTGGASRKREIVRGHYREYEEFELDSETAVKHAAIILSTLGINLDEINRPAREHNLRNQFAIERGDIERMRLVTYVLPTVRERDTPYRLAARIVPGKLVGLI
jgi:hypothetical protein